MKVGDKFLLLEVVQQNMDTKELICKSQAVALKEEEGDIVTVMERMQIKGTKFAANCLVRKVLLTRGINREGLKTAMQQAWRIVREVKIQNIVDNIFLFKFATKEDKKRVLMGGLWHFDRALLVLSEPTGMADIKNQSSTHRSFWVQIHNVPIMCMNRGAIQKLGKKIGAVKEIETDETRDCIG